MVALDIGVHVLGRELGGAQSQAVETEGKLVIAAVVIVIFTARIERAEQQLPVVFLFVLVVFDGDAASVVFDLDRAVVVGGEDDLFAVALARLIDGV